VLCAAIADWVYRRCQFLDSLDERNLVSTFLAYSPHLGDDAASTLTLRTTYFGIVCSDFGDQVYSCLTSISPSDTATSRWAKKRRREDKIAHANATLETRLGLAEGWPQTVPQDIIFERLHDYYQATQWKEPFYLRCMWTISSAAEVFQFSCSIRLDRTVSIKRCFKFWTNLLYGIASSTNSQMNLTLIMFFSVAWCSRKLELRRPSNDYDKVQICDRCCSFLRTFWMYLGIWQIKMGRTHRCERHRKFGSPVTDWVGDWRREVVRLVACSTRVLIALLGGGTPCIPWPAHTCSSISGVWEAWERQHRFFTADKSVIIAIPAGRSTETETLELETRDRPWIQARWISFSENKNTDRVKANTRKKSTTCT
jgi:hypothetical protein